MLKTHKPVSVVVATYNRKQGLEDCLIALSQQTISQFNVIIVNDGGTKVDKKRVVGIFEKLPMVKILVINKQQNSGSASVRNLGFKSAPQGLVVFTDDDAIPEPSWLQQIQQYFEKYPDTTAVSGRIAAVSLRHISERLRQAFYDYRDNTYSNQKKNSSFASYSSFTPSEQNFADWISLGNCAIKKTPDGVLRSPFDTSRARNYSHRLAKRLMREGKLVAYSTEPSIRHDHRRGALALLNIRRQTGINFCIIDDENHTSFFKRLRTCREYIFYMFFVSRLKPQDKFIEVFLSILFITCYSAQLIRGRIIKRKENSND